MTKRKIRVAVIYGGRSGEHEVSLQSGASVIRHLDRERFEIIPVGIDKQGHWHLGDLSLIEGAKVLPIFKDEAKMTLRPFAEGQGGEILPLDGGSARTRFDVVFPVVHGPLCEDGSIQGFFELADVPFVGSGVLGSAVAMDKDVAKRLVASAGVTTESYLVYRRGHDAKAIEAEVHKKLRYPVFVKPVNMGSSVGIRKVDSPKGLSGAVQEAFLYDSKIIIEKGVNAREIEFAVLEDADPSRPPLVSVAGEIVPKGHAFYSYESKYTDENGAELIIPAKLSKDKMAEGQELAARIFTALELGGLARIDLFLEKGSDRFIFNEANTLPGFTKISMYPKLWEASGIPYKELLSRLVDIAIKRHHIKSQLKRDWTS